MAIQISRGTSDEILDSIRSALEPFLVDHPNAQIDLYRQNPVSVRVRIIDPDFHSLDKSERHEQTWIYLNHLSEEAQGDLSMLVLLTPEETTKSFANLEFDDPVPSLS